MCSSVHPLFPSVARSIQQWRAAGSVLTQVTAQAWHSLPGVFLGAWRGWGATRWVNCCFFLILLHSECAFSSFPSPSAQLSRLQLSPPVQPSDGKAKALCTRELHPSLLQGGLDHGTTLQFLYCCVLTLCVVIWTDPKLTASHWDADIPIQACLVPHRPGAFARCLI